MCSKVNCIECGEYEDRHDNNSNYCVDCSVICDCCNKVYHYERVNMYFCECGISSCNTCMCNCLKRISNSFIEKKCCNMCNYEGAHNSILKSHLKSKKHIRNIKCYIDNDFNKQDKTRISF